MQTVCVMKTDRIMKRSMELLAMLMIGDGVLAAIGPRRHVTLWMSRGSTSRWNRRLSWFAEHRGATRAIGVTELVVGFALARWQWRSR
jgi:hypothetical protein